jgi:hypothetical protein
VAQVKRGPVGEQNKSIAPALHSLQNMLLQKHQQSQEAQQHLHGSPHQHHHHYGQSSYYQHGGGGGGHNSQLKNSSGAKRKLSSSEASPLAGEYGSKMMRRDDARSSEFIFPEFRETYNSICKPVNGL